MAELAPGPPGRLGGLPGRRRRWASRDRLAGGVSILVDTDVPVGAGLSSSAALDLLGGAGALRDLVAPSCGRARPGGAGPRGRRTTSSVRRPASSTSRRRCCAPPGTRSSSTPATGAASRCRWTSAAAGLALLVVDIRRRPRPRRGWVRRPAAGVRGGGGAARGRPAARGGRRRRAGRPRRRHARGRGAAAPRPAHRHRERPGARGGRHAARGRPTRGRSGRCSPPATSRCATTSRSRSPVLDACVEAAVERRRARRPHGGRRLRRQRDRAGRPRRARRRHRRRAGAIRPRGRHPAAHVRTRPVRRRPPARLRPAREGGSARGRR